MKTAMVREEPCDPVNDGTILGHDVLPDGAMQTSPTFCACAGDVEAGSAKRDAMTTKTSATNFFIITLAPVFLVMESGSANIRLFWR